MRSTRLIITILSALAVFASCGDRGHVGHGPTGISAREAYMLALPEAQKWDGAARLIYLAVRDPRTDGRDAGPWTLEFGAEGRSEVLRVLVTDQGVLRSDPSDISACGYRQALPLEWIDSTELAKLLSARGAAARPGWIVLFLSADPVWPGEPAQPAWRAAFGDGKAGTWYLADPDGNPMGTRTIEGY